MAVPSRSTWETRVAIVPIPIGTVTGPGELERGMVQDAKLEALIREGWTLAATLQAEDKGVAMILLVFLRGPAQIENLHAEVAALRADLGKVSEAFSEAFSPAREGVQAVRLVNEIAALRADVVRIADRESAHAMWTVIGVLVWIWFVVVTAMIVADVFAALVLS